MAALRAKVEALRRAAKRQAAPFSRDNPKPKAERARPGRRPGDAYGTKAHRNVPDHVDRTVVVPAPTTCPGCGGEVEVELIDLQYQTELPTVRPFVTCYQIHVGRCRGCRRRVQPRHPEQVTDALGAAASHLGPRAVAFASFLNKGLGIPASKVATILLQVAGIEVTPGGIHQAVARTARRLEPTYGALIEAVRTSPVVSPDETGWRVEGRRAWLWAFVAGDVTVYLIAEGRGYAQACVVLGTDYGGIIVRDGWAPYRSFTAAEHQTCLAHLLRRCRGMVADSVGGQARVPHAVARILTDALALGDDRDAGRLALPAVAEGLAALEDRVEELLAWRPTHEPNDRLLDHLWTERENLFTFLEVPGLAATNWESEQGLRPMCVIRKNWGGNASWSGAHTTEVLASVLRTARQQDLDPVELLVPVLRSPKPRVAGLLMPGRDPP